MRTYEDFEIQIFADPEGFRAQAGGAGTSQRLKLDAQALTERWKRLTAAFAGQARANPEEVKDDEALGDELFRAVFTDNILRAWSDALARADEREPKEGVRLVLRVQEAGPLASLPWELLFDADHQSLLALSETTPVLRFPDVPERARVLAVRPPLRLLGVLAEPLGQPLLDLEGEWQAIEKALAPLCDKGLIEIERLASPTLPKLRARLKGEPAIHVLHFAGHGVAGALDLERNPRDRHREPALGQQLATLVGDAPQLRLVVINACEGAIGIEGESTTSLAFHLARKGLPAIVALQSAVSDGAARLFAQAFYGEIAKGNPLEAAVTEARNVLDTEHKGLAWAAPVLYLRASTGHVLKAPKDHARKPMPFVSARPRRARKILLGAAVIGILGIIAAAIAGRQLYENLTRNPPSRSPSDPAPVPPPSAPRCPSPRGLEFSFVEVLPGSFTMGAPANRGDRTKERPAHTVEITQSYCVGAFEVTVAQWDAVLTGHDAATKPQIDLPKVSVKWDETQNFVAKLNERDPGAGYRLLWEAEFEHAARAGSLAANVFGDSKENLAHDANCRGADDGFPKLAPIGSFRPNRRGLYDVQGNAEEWVADWYADYSPAGEPQRDPQGQPFGIDHVRRGGSFDMKAENCALWSRKHSKSSYSSNDLGFRIARSPK